MLNIVAIVDTDDDARVRLEALGYVGGILLEERSRPGLAGHDRNTS